MNRYRLTEIQDESRTGFVRRGRFAKWTASDLPDEVERMEEFVLSSVSWWNELLQRDELTPSDMAMIEDGAERFHDIADELDKFLSNVRRWYS